MPCQTSRTAGKNAKGSARYRVIKLDERPHAIVLQNSAAHKQLHEELMEDYMNNQETARTAQLCPFALIARAMTHGPKDAYCNPGCALYASRGCSLAGTADSLERIAIALEQIADREGAQ